MYDIAIMGSVKKEDVYPLGEVSDFVHFSFGSIISAVYAENLLAQKFLKLLFTNPGKTSSAGGGILSVIPETMNSSMLSSLKSKVAVSISKTESDIIKAQIGTKIPAKERLASVDFIDLTWDPNIRVLRLTIRIKSRAGDAWIVEAPLASAY